MKHYGRSQEAQYIPPFEPYPLAKGDLGMDP